MCNDTFVLEDYGNVPVKAPGLTKDQLKEWPPFKNWISTLTHSLSLQSQSSSHPFYNDPYRLKEITVESYNMFRANNIGFLKLDANVSTASNNNRLPGVIFLRGPAVAMLVVLIPADAPTDQLHDAYVLLTVQPRIATGSLGFVELPAGMLDGDSNFAGVAAKEIQEELGLVIKQNELTCLTDKIVEIKKAREENKAQKLDANKTDATKAEHIPFGMYPSAGGCDEYIKIFSHEKRVPRETLHEWEGKYGGLRDEGEMITLKLVPLTDLWLEGAMDSKALAAVTLYQQVKQWERSAAK
ncbi:Nudix hydrolase 14, chloroplastic [Cytospora mali]|uniref:Nudix hydrolase 14, chloroplastic n=1 Tax=Cytospora mali TaxID=578113 RepID=A0A194VA09_CYTMA|nr:Nudix hydrolase 14, chloroplastic [Valsa mali var. pyri (nom. inval.)]